MRQIGKAQRRALRATAIHSLARHLETNTVWGKHYARPSQIQPAARKLHDVLMAQVRREKKSAVRP